jgi:hypothetical protein
VLLASPLAATPNAPNGRPNARPAGDAELAGLLARSLPIVEQAGATADGGRGGADVVQAQYDAARDLEEALQWLPPVSSGCAQRLRAAHQLARGEILQAEGFDRPSARVAARGASLAATAARALRATPPCSRGKAVHARRIAPLLFPTSDEAFSGNVFARAPARTAHVQVIVDERASTYVSAGAGLLNLKLTIPPGLHTLELRFRDSRNHLLSLQRSVSASMLPSNWRATRPALREDRALDARLAALANSFDGQSAIWVQNLRSGREGSWNADARFPAASTVKLAVLIAALNKLGPHPENSTAYYDVRALATWSSNLAANRLLRTLAGSEAAGAALAQATLRRVGASSSTYTGDYRVGTAVTRPTDAPDPPLLVSQRTTTARDLARILELIARAAGGDADALRTSELTPHEAKLALGLLLASQPAADNLGLFRPWLPPPFPLAQKNGWISQARHTAAILYAQEGPRIAVLLTFRSTGLTRLEAAALGRAVVRIALAVR